ncbi:MULTISPECIES: flagellar basal-body MS-ring/collar protein FliF [unclassified Luteibacter]|uniref:flagellar basal-body MS-ring/collar protein FliF n=1 Tax=unclassified Luteibacter TaxID=2620188 RepID=UPI0008C28ED5|nr:MULTISPECIES: flagellar basal-body MS-ring/collar protein FliF [unclassified Luteibacter]MDR6936613.1 flagellar M-ring protein FliF [Luteibacter sp. 3190]SEO66728.1 flagellar M-ring protein FliF [Luteibacter sp. UNC138MFCol5.1]SEV83875.1 flagellar M-ring protein FliF [Luteibacter sp. 329MFSha]
MADNGVATTDSNTASRMDSLKSLAQTPAARQLFMLAGIAGAVAIGIAAVMWSRAPNYGLLYGGLEQKDAAAVTQALQAGNTPYTLSTDGSSIFVPAADVAGVRLKLAGQGLPQGSAASAVPQTDSPFGMSDMAERSRYQSLLENDLSNTIAGLQSVRAARVHLALPKPSAFIRDNKPASASVVVTLYPGRQLDQGQVAAIVHLVAASVPDLDTRQVSVIDQAGNLLTVSDPDSASAIGDSRLRLSNRIEATYTQRVEDLLTPLVGAGKVRAQVFADLDFSQTEKASETFNHDNPALRSEQTSSDTRTEPANNGGVPGALSNQPPNTGANATAANPAAGGKAGAQTASTQATQTPTQQTQNATRNYELDRTVSHVTDPAGKVARLSVAVVVDNKQVPDKDGKTKSVPFTPEELTRLTELTKNAVGFSAARGDSVSVINEAFHGNVAEEAPQSTPFWERPGMLDLIKQGLGVMIALIVGFFVLRPILKGLLKPAPLAMNNVALAGPMPTVSVMVDDDDMTPDRVSTGSQAQLGSPALLAYEQKVGLAKRMAAENPKQVAQVVKSWVSDDGG